MRRYKTDVVELRKMMAEKGINTILELSKKSGINRNTLGKILDGSIQPSSDAMDRLVYTLEIQPETPYPEDYSECGDVALGERDNNERPAIANLPESIDQYDTILVGYPIWWHTAPMIIGTFLESYDLTGKTIAPFCSHGGGRLGQSVTAIGKLAPASNLTEGLSVHYRGGSSLSADIDQWLKANKLI